MRGSKPVCSEPPTLRRRPGRAECHLHMVRHGAAHRIFMHLMAAHLDRTPDLFPHLPKNTLWLRGVAGNPLAPVAQRPQSARASRHSL